MASLISLDSGSDSESCHESVSAPLYQGPDHLVLGVDQPTISQHSIDRHELITAVEDKSDLVDITRLDSDSDSGSDGSDFMELDLLSADSTSDAHQIPAYSSATILESTSARTEDMSALSRLYAYIHAHSNPYQDSASVETKRKEADAYKNAPIFTSGVARHMESGLSQNLHISTSLNQFGLIGLNQRAPFSEGVTFGTPEEVVKAEDNMVIANMDVPWSAFICGSQGAGKSHTLSCLLENALLADKNIGNLPDPLAAVVFHYDNYTSATCSQVCEAAYLCSSGIPVTVLVSPSNIWAMTELYTNLPGLPKNAPKPKVLPLYLSESLLDISTMLKLMAVEPDADSMPLYMTTVMVLLREMAMEGKGAGKFSYSEFRERLDAVNWVPGQRAPLDLRLQLLDSFLEPSKFTKSTKPAPAKDNIWEFKQGSMTIVDLSDPFVSSNDACSLFSICLSLFIEDRASCGRVVALDEAHKFLLQSGAAVALTQALTSVIRQQRHTGTRVFIATQEPTLSPDLIDLANATFVHRFSSPAWYEVLKKHLAGAKRYDSTNQSTSLFETIVALETGEALVFCPTAAVGVVIANDLDKILKLGNGYLRVQVRKRVTVDGGRSILASETKSANSTAVTHDIPMHIVERITAPKGPGKGNKTSGYQAPTNNMVSTRILRSSTVNHTTSEDVSAGGAASTHNGQQDHVAPKQKATNAMIPQIRELTQSFVSRNYKHPHLKPMNGRRLDEIVQYVENHLSVQTGSIKKQTHLMAAVQSAIDLRLNEIRRG